MKPLLRKIAAVILAVAFCAGVETLAQQTPPTASAAVTATPAPVRATSATGTPAAQGSTGNSAPARTIGDIPAAVLNPMGAAIRKVLNEPELKAAWQKIQDSSAKGTAAVRAFINKDPARIDFLTKNLRLKTYFAAHEDDAFIAANPARDSAAGPRANGAASANSRGTTDPSLAGQSPENIATVQAMLKALQADPEFLAAEQEHRDAALAYIALLRSTISKDAAMKELVEKNPDAFDYLAATSGVVPAIPSGPRGASSAPSGTVFSTDAAK